MKCNKKLKRDDIGGFTLKLLKGYDIEVVTEKKIPKTLAISKNKKTIKRFGK